MVRKTETEKKISKLYLYNIPIASNNRIKCKLKEDLSPKTHLYVYSIILMILWEKSRAQSIVMF